MSLRQAATDRLRAWAARRHGADTLPVAIDRRRIYILPTRFGLVIGALLAAMLIAGLNYNSNLALGYVFLMSSLALVAMHHCHRNLLGLIVDVNLESDAFAGHSAVFDFMLRNDSRLERSDIQVSCAHGAESAASVAALGYAEVSVEIPVTRRGIERWSRIELRTSHPFGWFRAWTYVHVALTAYVAPEPIGERPLPCAAAQLGTSAESHASGDEEFAGLRAYAPGMPLKHMAWKVLARGGDPAVRSYSSLAAQPEWLEWSSLAGLDDEARLSQLCLWVLECAAAQRHYGLRIPGKEIAPSGGAAHRFACLRALAAFGLDET